MTMKSGYLLWHTELIFFYYLVYLLSGKLKQSTMIAVTAKTIFFFPLVTQVKIYSILKVKVGHLEKVKEE